MPFVKRRFRASLIDEKLFQIEDASASASVIVPSNSKKPFWTTAIASSPPCWISSSRLGVDKTLLARAPQE
jgi:hypothetical protein